MSNEYMTPILLTTGTSFANHWLSGGGADVKILLAGGLAIGIAALISQVPGAAPVVGGIAWVAFAASLVVPVKGKTPPLINLLNTLSKDA